MIHCIEFKTFAIPSLEIIVVIDLYLVFFFFNLFLCFCDISRKQMVKDVVVVSQTNLLKTKKKKKQNSRQSETKQQQNINKIFYFYPKKRQRNAIKPSTTVVLMA